MMDDVWKLLEHTFIGREPHNHGEEVIPNQWGLLMALFLALAVLLYEWQWARTSKQGEEGVIDLQWLNIY